MGGYRVGHGAGHMECAGMTALWDWETCLPVQSGDMSPHSFNDKDAFWGRSKTFFFTADGQINADEEGRDTNFLKGARIGDNEVVMAHWPAADFGK